MNIICYMKIPCMSQTLSKHLYYWPTHIYCNNYYTCISSYMPAYRYCHNYYISYGLYVNICVGDTFLFLLASILVTAIYVSIFFFFLY